MILFDRFAVFGCFWHLLLILLLHCLTSTSVLIHQKGRRRKPGTRIINYCSHFPRRAERWSWRCVQVLHGHETLLVDSLVQKKNSFDWNSKGKTSLWALKKTEARTPMVHFTNKRPITELHIRLNPPLTVSWS